MNRSATNVGNLTFICPKFIDMRMIGKPAPDFTLFDSDKNKVTLSEQKGGSVLLLFFPLAFTSTCTTELCAIRDNLAWYNRVHAKVFGISVDSLYSLKVFKKEQNLNFPLLSDFNKEVSALFGVLYEKFSYGMKGVSKRASFILDQDGIIQYEEVLENAGLLPDFVKINQVLEALNKV
jgi:glutaredoxin-dependent peroxiredoxin